jgi:hypothetical protein
MKKTPPVHVISNPRGGWSVKKEGAGRATAVLPTQKEAISKARSVSKIDKTELVIHKKDGTIQRKDTNPPKDKDTHKR